MDRDGTDYSLPWCEAQFIVEQLLEIGPVLAGAMGSAPIGWRDLEAWQACTFVQLPPWQARMLVSLSREYASFSVKAEKHDCPAPWAAEPMTEARREVVAQSLRTGFQALISTKGR
jgi:hypothetical protein